MPGVESQGSPTFALQWSYRSKSEARVPSFEHLDLYRLKSEEELEAAGLLDLLWDPKTVVAVEWLSLFPEIETLLSKRLSVLKIEIEPTSDGRRRYSVSFV